MKVMDSLCYCFVTHDNPTIITDVPFKWSFFAPCVSKEEVIVAMEKNDDETIYLQTTRLWLSNRVTRQKLQYEIHAFPRSATWRKAIFWECTQGVRPRHRPVDGPTAWRGQIGTADRRTGSQLRPAAERQIRWKLRENLRTWWAERTQAGPDIPTPTYSQLACGSDWTLDQEVLRKGTREDERSRSVEKHQKPNPKLTASPLTQQIN